MKYMVRGSVLALGFDEAMSLLPDVPPKDEFETTAQYQARLAASASAAPKELIIALQPLNGTEPIYDADSKRLMFDKTAMRGISMNWQDAFLFAGGAGGIAPHRFHNVGVVVSTESLNEEVRIASNAFGATTPVTVTERRVEAIYDGPGEDYLKSSSDPFTRVGLYLPMEEARHLKQEASYAVVVTPRPPYVVRGRYQSHVAEMDMPFETHDEFEIMTATIHCTLITDSTGKVYAAFPGR